MTSSFLSIAILRSGSGREGSRIKDSDDRFASAETFFDDGAEGGWGIGLHVVARRAEMEFGALCSEQLFKYRRKAWILGELHHDTTDQFLARHKVVFASAANKGTCERQVVLWRCRSGGRA